ncbi:uncharacterized protein LOC133423294 isoform X2 [Cololabis saira]|uniref:uncharacterized protein LOC133423294 isoform X2 n=1 Tax=Cololabis saira TaxID=129043 RepID=UPI002AD51224|nr:uncharacterized protein LOC133423294 isoform X2 [Cololabis saira]
MDLAADRGESGAPLSKRKFIISTSKVCQIKDQILQRCVQSCRAAGHYHCPYCSRTLIRRLDMKRHLASCHHELTSVSTEPDLHPAISMQPGPSQDLSCSQPLVQEAAEMCGKSFKCLLCGFNLLRKNYRRHMLRKHADLSQDFTQSWHLQGFTADETNDIFAAQKTGNGISVPVRIQRDGPGCRPWGKWSPTFKKKIPYLNFKGQILQRCVQSCRAAGHYHCPYCSRTLIRRLDMKRHLALCHHQLTSVSTEPDLHHATTLKEPDFHPAVPSMQQELSCSQPLVQEAAEMCGKSFKCLLCGFNLLRKNYRRHMLRKHADLSKDITQAWHLQGFTADETNDIFAAQKTGNRISVPVRIQKDGPGCRPWGKWSPTFKKKVSHLNFKDQILQRCVQPCRPAGHYHCPYCSRTVIRRLDMERHLPLCHHQLTLASTEPDPHPAVPSMQPGPSQAQPLVQDAAEMCGKSFKCLLCGFNLLKKNYHRHMLRKHADLSLDITQACYLRGFTADNFAAVKTEEEISVPVQSEEAGWQWSATV